MADKVLADLGLPDIEAPENKPFKSPSTGKRVEKFVQDNGPALYGGAGALAGGIPGAFLGGAAGKYVQNARDMPNTGIKGAIPSMEELPGMAMEGAKQAGLETVGKFVAPFIRGGVALTRGAKVTPELIHDAGEAIGETGLFHPGRGAGKMVARNAEPIAEAMNTPAVGLGNKMINAGMQSHLNNLGDPGVLSELGSKMMIGGGKVVNKLATVPNALRVASGVRDSQ